jgi:hypothetical protein
MRKVFVALAVSVDGFMTDRALGPRRGLGVATRMPDPAARSARTGCVVSDVLGE